MYFCVQWHQANIPISKMRNRNIDRKDQARASPEASRKTTKFCVSLPTPDAINGFIDFQQSRVAGPAQFFCCVICNFSIELIQVCVCDFP